MDSLSDRNSNGNPPSNNSGEEDNGNGSAAGAGGATLKPKIKVDPQSLYYDMTGEKHLVVFNHYKYDVNTHLETRVNTGHDVNALEETFKGIGFKVDIHHDEDRASIWNILRELREKDYSTASCLCIAILTHGNEYGFLSAYDRQYKLNDVIKLFTKHPTLAGKPKIFFIQACRGYGTDEGITIETDGDSNGNYYIISSHADFLIVRSTVEGNVSWNDERGSWMIQELCRAIKEYHKYMDVLQIVTCVHSKVALAYSSYTPRDVACSNMRQVPETTFTLTKILKF